MLCAIFPFHAKVMLVGLAHTEDDRHVVYEVGTVGYTQPNYCCGRGAIVMSMSLLT